MVRQIAINGYDNNFSYFVSDGLREDIAIVDPGNVPLLLAYIEQDSLIPKMILLTHSHHDHVDGVAELIMRYALPDNTEIYPGHDYGSKPVSILAWEKKHNQYIMCKSLTDFIKLRL